MVGGVIAGIDVDTSDLRHDGPVGDRLSQAVQSCTAFTVGGRLSLELSGDAADVVKESLDYSGFGVWHSDSNVDTVT